MQELATFEEMPNGPQLKTADLIRDGNLNGTEAAPLFYSFVAEADDGTLVGYTIGFFAYSTWQGKSYFLEDLYVKPDWRKKSVGKDLFNYNVRFAVDENCSRFDFHVLNWNPAKEFYEKLGAQNLSKNEGWEFYRLGKNQMHQLLNKQ